MKNLTVEKTKLVVDALLYMSGHAEDWTVECFEDMLEDYRYDLANYLSLMEDEDKEEWEDEVDNAVKQAEESLDSLINQCDRESDESEWNYAREH